MNWGNFTFLLILVLIILLLFIIFLSIFSDEFILLLLETLDKLTKDAQEVIEIVGGGYHVGEQGYLDEWLWSFHLCEDQTGLNAQWEINSGPYHKSQHNIESIDFQESEMGDIKVTKRQGKSQEVSKKKDGLIVAEGNWAILNHWKEN